MLDVIVVEVSVTGVVVNVAEEDVEVTVGTVAVFVTVERTHTLQSIGHFSRSVAANDADCTEKQNGPNEAMHPL